MPQRTLLLKTPENANIIANIQFENECKISFIPPILHRCRAAIYVNGKTRLCEVQNNLITLCSALPTNAEIAIFLLDVRAFGCQNIDASRRELVKLSLINCENNPTEYLQDDELNRPKNPPPQRNDNPTLHPKNGVEPCKANDTCPSTQSKTNDSGAEIAKNTLQNTAKSNVATSPSFELLYLNATPCTPFAKAGLKWRQCEVMGKNLFLALDAKQRYFGVEGSKNAPPDNEKWNFVPFDGSQKEGLWIITCCN